MDLEPGKTDGKRKRVSVQNARGTKVEDGNTDNRGEKTEDAGEPLPKRILRSVSKKFPVLALPAVEVKKPKSTEASTSRKQDKAVTASKDKEKSFVKKKTKITEIANPTSSKSREFLEPQITKKGKKPTKVSNPTTKTVTGTNEILSSENNTFVGKEFTFKEELPKIDDPCSSLDTTTDEPMQERKNPMLLSPVIRCIFGFLDIENVKRFRFVSGEWSSAGKQALTSRASIRFEKVIPDRLPIDFYSCFLNSAARFTSFQISGYSWTIEELSQFFEEQQKSIRELAFNATKIMKDNKIVRNFDISPWISKSPMVKSDVKYLTKLSIDDVDCAIPLHLLQHIKDLSLSYCRINLEAGVKMHPVKLSLKFINFYQDEALSSVLINDIVNFNSAKKIDLNGYFPKTAGGTNITINLSGNCSLESLTLLSVDFVNWETSNWDIHYMRLNNVEFPAKTQMTINELFLSSFDTGNFDIFSLPRSIEKLGINIAANITCTELTTLENLKYLSVQVKYHGETDFSYLAHFRNCPQLTHLKFCGFREHFREIKLAVIPETVRTLTLDNCSIDWAGGAANIEKIVFFNVEINFEKILQAKISVEDIILICDEPRERKNVQIVANFLKYRKRFSFCKRFFIGKLTMGKMRLKDSVLNEHVDTKSAFYVFENNGGKGRALDEKSFYQLAEIPKHITLKYTTFP